MIVEQRTSACHCGKAQQYVKMYEAEGLASQRPILGHLLGYFTSEIGELNQVCTSKHTKDPAAGAFSPWANGPAHAAAGFQ